MGNATKVTTPPIVPIYSQANPNQSIDLGREAIRLEYNRTEYCGRANVAMRFGPNDRLEFKCTVEDESPSFLLSLAGATDWDGKLTLTERGVTLDVLCVAAGRYPHEVVFTPKSGLSVRSISLPTAPIC